MRCALLLVVLMVGCSSSPETQGELAERLFTAWCDQQLQCGAPNCDVSTLWGTYCEEHDCSAINSVPVDTEAECIGTIGSYDCSLEYEPHCMAALLQQYEALWAGHWAMPVPSPHPTDECQAPQVYQVDFDGVGTATLTTDIGSLSMAYTADTAGVTLEGNMTLAGWISRPARLEASKGELSGWFAWHPDYVGLNCSALLRLTSQD